MNHRFDTSFSRLVGIDLPIVQAPVGGISTPALAAAVSEAGGLGTLSITWREPDALRALLRETRALTGKPFAVNLVLAWDPAERLEIALAAGVRIVSFFWGDPAPWVEPVHAAGGIVLHTVASAEEARRAGDAGVDAVVAQGWEAGGHVWGEVATMALVPRVVDAVSPVPVVAAGGIADGRGLAAALALGAGAAWMGTRFLLAEEAATHPVYREAPHRRRRNGHRLQRAVRRRLAGRAAADAAQPDPGGVARGRRAAARVPSRRGRDGRRRGGRPPHRALQQRLLRWPGPTATSPRWRCMPAREWGWRSARNPPPRSCARWRSRRLRPSRG